MIYIQHRIHQLQELEALPSSYGLECDIRYHENELILAHDPFHHHETSPPRFETLLKAFVDKGMQGPLILNVKTEGVEERCLELLEKYKPSSWFFLDLSMPYFCKYAELAQAGTRKGFSKENLAVRFSEYEPIEYSLSFQNKAAWVWVDCFTHWPLDQKSVKRLHEAGFKLCLVSPELQKHPLEKIDELPIDLSLIAAVCTKHPERWKRQQKLQEASPC